MTPLPLSWVLLALVVLTGAAGAAGYWQGGKHRQQQLEAQAARDERQRDETLRLVAEAVSKIEVRNVTIRQKAETITREVPVYRECRHDADGLRVVNDALADPAARPAADRGVPAADTPDG